MRMAVKRTTTCSVIFTVIVWPKYPQINDDFQVKVDMNKWHDDMYKGEEVSHFADPQVMTKFHIWLNMSVWEWKLKQMRSEYHCEG